MTDDTRWNDGAEAPPRVSRPAPGRSVEVIKADIERTQAELADTLEALQRKLHPRRLVGNARGAVKDYTSRLANTAFSAGICSAAVGTAYAERAGQRMRKEMEARPRASVLVAAGLASLAWLWLTRRSRHDRPASQV